MEERDPFGREKDDDPLADMGWSGSEAAPPEAGTPDVAEPERPDLAAERQVSHEQLPGMEPAAPPPDVPSPTAPVPETPAPPRTPPPRSDYRADYRQPLPPQTRRTIGCAPLGCLIPVLVIGFIGAVFATVIPRIIDEAEDIVPTVPSDPGGRDAPQGLERRSMLLRANFGPALRRLERETGSGRVRLLRVAADRVDVQVAVSGGRTRLAQATFDGETRVITTTPGGAGKTYPWSRVDPAAPQRIVRSTTEGRRSSEFDYAVLLDAVGLRWSAFLKNGGQFQAPPDGRDVTRLGG